MDVYTEFTEVIDDTGILHGKVVGKSLQTGLNTHVKQASYHIFRKEILSQNADQIAIFLVWKLFKCHVPLQTQSDVPEGSDGEQLSIFQVSLLSVGLAEAPEFHEGCHELAFVSLSTDEGQTDSQIIVDTALNYNALFDLF